MCVRRIPLRIIALVLTTTTLALPRHLEGQEQCLTDAWEVFDRSDYAAAIRFADRCIDDFGPAAARMQASFVTENVPAPPTGAVSDAERNKIFQRGLLNDVATAFFVKGRSSEYLYRNGGPDSERYKNEAEASYRQACELSHGRAWDPKGWFWSPCEAAQDRLPLR